MKARPIPMHARSIQNLLAGRKTQTRRIVKGPWQGLPLDNEDYRREALAKCPHGSPGDLLWCREAWRTGKLWDSDRPRDIPADSSVSYEVDGEGQRMSGRYRHARFMPRWASRLTLRLTDVRVERVQNCSEADAKAEGVDCIVAKTPTDRDAFRYLWDDTNGTGAWERNDYVWALTFDILRENVAGVLARERKTTIAETYGAGPLPS